MSKTNSMAIVFMAAINRFETLRNLFKLEYPVDIQWLMKEYNLSLWNNEYDYEDVDLSIKLLIYTYRKHILRLDKQCCESSDIGFALPDIYRPDNAIFVSATIGSDFNLRVELNEPDIKKAIILKNPLELKTKEEKDALAILTSQKIPQDRYDIAVKYLKQRFGQERVSYMML